MSEKLLPKARKENLVVQNLNGEVLIYDLDTNKAFCLNESSALIWQACDGNRDVSEIRAALGKQLNAPVNDDFVWLALDQLKKENLIENKDEVAIDFNGMSRRDVIKKVGLASVIALPIVTGLVAPKAANASSVCGSTCANNGDCTNTACPTCKQISNQNGNKTCQ